MLKLAAEHPAYGFEQHKGYGTKAHLQAIREHGLCAIHRSSFIHLDRVS
jgi:ribonuclease HII